MPILLEYNEALNLKSILTCLKDHQKYLNHRKGKLVFDLSVENSAGRSLKRSILKEQLKLKLFSRFTTEIKCSINQSSVECQMLLMSSPSFLEAGQ